MRLKFFVCGVTTVLPALLLAGCGMNQMSMVTPDTASPAVVGRAFGGQQPVVGATISVVQMGTTGYGSTGIILASTITDSGGNFSFAPNAYACPQPDTPVYLLGIGGNAGSGNNPSAVEAAALGTCANGKNSFVIMNEVTTAATAVVFSHFFSTTLGGANAANDWIGGPSTTPPNSSTVYSRGLEFGGNVTIPAIISNAVGAPNMSGTTSDGTAYTVEGQKINAIANVLAACINSSGSTSTTETRTTCGKLFNFTANGSTPRPSDTLQAAVQMALFPTSRVSNIFNLITPQAPFAPSLTAAPNDWTIGVSYTTTKMGLAVDPGTTSTLDIDSSGRIWFPSNASGQIGAAYFDSTGRTFSGPFNTTSLTHPQQVAIDANGYAWYNDSASATVSGYLTTAPMTTQSVSFPGTTSNAVTVGADDRINVGIDNSSTPELANISADRSTYSALAGVSFADPVASVAGDTSNGDGVSTSTPPTTAMQDFYVLTAGSTTTVTRFATANANGAQIIFTGNDDIGIRSYAGNAADGVCIKTRSACSNFVGALHNAAQGIAIDGGKNLWVAESLNSSILRIPVNNPAGADGAVYLNSSGANNVPNDELQHDATNSGTGTATAPAPFGIGVDVAGNVWVSNAGCNTAGCTPGNFTLTELVGAGFPTITPVSAQITNGNLVGTKPTN